MALVGHTGAGKTTLAEALLAKAGAIASAGSVEKGNTVCDFDPLEKEYKHSLNSALVNFAWKNVHIHLIDTPGSPDFMGQAIGALAAVETAVVEDRRFGAELRAKLRADIEHGARVVARTRWFRQPLRRRIPMWIGYGLARLAIGVFGFGGRF